MPLPPKGPWRFLNYLGQAFWVRRMHHSIKCNCTRHSIAHSSDSFSRERIACCNGTHTELPEFTRSGQKRLLHTNNYKSNHSHMQTLKSQPGRHSASDLPHTLSDQSISSTQPVQIHPENHIHLETKIHTWWLARWEDAHDSQIRCAVYCRQFQDTCAPAKWDCWWYVGLDAQVRLWWQILGRRETTPVANGPGSPKQLFNSVEVPSMWSSQSNHLMYKPTNWESTLKTPSTFRKPKDNSSRTSDCLEKNK